MTDRAQAEVVKPEAGRRYVDRRGGRELEVTTLQPGDPLGREVLGLVTTSPRNGHAPREYSTDLRIFAAIWSPA